MLVHFTIILLGCLPSWVASSTCTPSNPPSDACAVSGSLSIISVPAGLPVDATHCNIIYNITDFVLHPKVIYPDAIEGKLYILFMTDPDVPLYPEGVVFNHWTVTNIPGEDLRAGILEGSTEISIYKPPTPLPFPFLHRYMFFLYILSKPVTQPIPLPQQLLFNFKLYLKQLELQGVHVCGPVAAVQFRAALTPAPPAQ